MSETPQWELRLLPLILNQTYQDLWDYLICDRQQDMETLAWCLRRIDRRRSLTFTDHMETRKIKYKADISPKLQIIFVYWIYENKVRELWTVLT